MAEPVDSGPHRRSGIAATGDVQLDSQQVVRLTQDRGHAIAVPTLCHNRVAGRQGGLGEIDAHATAGAGNKPDLFAYSSPLLLRCASEGQRPTICCKCSR
jgi:hypothetical protein